MTSPMTDSDIEPFSNYCETSAQPRYIRQEDGLVTYVSHDEILGSRGAPYGPYPRLADFNTYYLLPWQSGYPETTAIHFQFNIMHIVPQKSFFAYHGLTKLIYGIWDYWQMWNLLGDNDLFDNSLGDDGEYDAHVHLAQLVSVSGEPPALPEFW
ncbi:hypothetical protein E4U37_006920 [Claviceps purpurea]|nr:hypothetical protein E4U37_006920 [Claviceps purpurea]